MNIFKQTISMRCLVQLLGQPMWIHVVFPSHLLLRCGVETRAPASYWCIDSWGAPTFEPCALGTACVFEIWLQFHQNRVADVRKAAHFSNIPVLAGGLEDIVIVPSSLPHFKIVDFPKKQMVMTNAASNQPSSLGISSSCS